MGVLYNISLPVTVTVNRQVAWLPLASWNVYVTWVVPRGKLLNGACDLSTVGLSPELSVAVGSGHVTVVVVEPGATGMLMLPGQLLITGAIVSTETAQGIEFNIYNYY